MWFFMSLLSAFFTATTAALSKFLLKDNDEYLVGWLRCLVSAPFFILLLFYIKIPKIDPAFFRILLILLPLEISAYFLYLKAIKASPLSLTMPFLSLTPVFMLFTTRLMLNERIDAFGTAGILLVFAGAYILNIERSKKSLLSPIRSILREKGSVYMIIVAFIYSITAILGKLAVNNSSHIFMSAVYFPVITLLLFPVMMTRYSRQGKLIRALRNQKWLFLLLGGVFFVTVVVHFFALSISIAAYMVAVKRLSMIFAIIYGWLVFRETHIRNRLLGTAIMILGVVFISLA